jgi:hypothetical protein
MNEFKKALLDVAGDMSDSERAVKNAVLYGNKRRRKLPFIKLVPAFVILCMMIGIGLWAVPKTVDNLSAQNPINDSLYTYYIEMESLSWSDSTDEQNRNNAYVMMLQTLGKIEYAKSIGLKATEEDYASMEETLQMLETSFDTLPYEPISKKQYVQDILPILQEKAVYENLLKKKWYDMFPFMTDSIANLYSNQKALAHMEAHYEKQLTQFKEQQHIETSFTTTSIPAVGVVAMVKDNMFYFMQNKVAQELDEMSVDDFQTTVSANENSLNAWIINDERVPLQVGDYVKLYAPGWNTEESNREMITIALPDHFEVLQRQSDGISIEEVTLSEEDSVQFKELLKSAKWQDNSNFRIYSDVPLYVVHTNEESYKIWQSSQRKLFYIMPFEEENFAQLTQLRTSEIKQILELNKAK